MNHARRPRPLGPFSIAAVASRRAGQVPLLPVLAAGVAFSGRGFCAEVEEPAGDEAAENGNVSYDDGDVVFDVVDAVIDRIGPVRLVECVQTVTVGEIDFSSADGSDAANGVSFLLLVTMLALLTQDCR